MHDGDIVYMQGDWYNKHTITHLPLVVRYPIHPYLPSYVLG